MFSKTALVALVLGAQLSLAAPVRSEERSLKAIHSSVPAFISNLGQENTKRAAPSLMVDTKTGTIYAQVPDANVGRTLKGLGAAIAGGIASGAAGSLVSDILGNNKRDNPSAVAPEDMGILDRLPYGAVAYGRRSPLSPGDLPAFGLTHSPGFGDSEVLAARSIKGLGTAIAGGIASGAAHSIGDAILGNDNRRSVGPSIPLDVLRALGPGLGPGRGVAVSTKRDEQLDARSFRVIGSVLGGLFGGDNNKRDEPLDARALGAIKGPVDEIFKRDELNERSLLGPGLGPGLFKSDPLPLPSDVLRNLDLGKRSELEESMAKRSVDDLE